MRTEQIQQRIDGMTVDLAPAVQSGSGARFFMLLSMIASNQELMGAQATPAMAGGEFQLPQVANVYPDVNSFYTPELTERMNRAVQDGLSGEFALLNSYLHTRSHIPRPQWQTADPSRLSGQLMTEEVEHSRQQLVAAA